MDLLSALRSTGAARSFPDEPVTDETVHAILETARFAPSGGNRQGWRVAVVKDGALRRQMGELMQGVWDEYMAAASGGRTPFTVVAAGNYSEPRVVAGGRPNPVIADIEHHPVVLVIAVDLSLVAMMDQGLSRPPLTGGASLYPFCWSILLAARAFGVGGVLTTFLSRKEPEAGAVLGLPAGWAIGAVIVLGHPVHQPTRLTRRPVEAFATVDRFDGEAFLA